MSPESDYTYTTRKRTVSYQKFLCSIVSYRLIIFFQSSFCNLVEDRRFLQRVIKVISTLSVIAPQPAALIFSEQANCIRAVGLLETLRGDEISNRICVILQFAETVLSSEISVSHTDLRAEKSKSIIIIHTHKTPFLLALKMRQERAKSRSLIHYILSAAPPTCIQ